MGNVSRVLGGNEWVSPVLTESFVTWHKAYSLMSSSVARRLTLPFP